MSIILREITSTAYRYNRVQWDLVFTKCLVTHALNLSRHRSIRPDAFHEKSFLKNFAKCTEKKLQHRCFPVNIARFLRTPI